LSDLGSPPTKANETAFANVKMLGTVAEKPPLMKTTIQRFAFYSAEMNAYPAKICLEAIFLLKSDSATLTKNTKSKLTEFLLEL